MPYYAYAQSLLDGGIIMRGAAYRSILNPLFITQKYILKAAEIIFCKTEFYLFFYLNVLK
jgi:hypothetical protein